MSWKLRIKDHNSNRVSEKILDKPSAKIGRDPNADVILNHNRVSRRHMELLNVGSDTVSLIDSSTNGTFLRENEKWIRVRKSIEMRLPFVLRIEHWTINVQKVAPRKLTADGDGQTWDQSVMVPASSRGCRTEAILVFDLCESSLIASEDENMAYHLKQRLTQIAEPVIDEFGYRFFKSTGDGFIATFEDVEKSREAAIKLEERIQYRNRRTSNVPIHYRIALHYGDVWTIYAGADDVHGHDVNITFRVEGAQSEAFPSIIASFPRRDRILCSGVYYELAKQNEKYQPSAYLYCGAATLKNIVQPVEIYWLKTQYSAANIE